MADAEHAIREADARRTRGEWVSSQRSRTHFATYATEWPADKNTGLTLAARSGATLPDLMNRAGHTTPRAALVYLHTDAERDQAVAASMDALVEGEER